MSSGENLDEGKQVRSLVLKRLRVTAIFAVVLYALLVTAPVVLQSIGPPGIDPGWIWALNIAPSSDIEFGKDIVFTHGPFGYLLTPLDIGNNLVLGNLFLLILHGTLGFAVIRIALFHRDLGATLLFTVLFLIAFRQDPLQEVMILTGIAMLCLVALNEERPTIAALAGVIAGFCCYVKLNLAVIGLVILLISAILAFVRSRGSRLPLAFLVAAGTAFCVTGLLSFDSFAAAFNWLQLSIDQVSGYAAAASVPEQPRRLIVGVALLVGWLFFGFALRRHAAIAAFHLMVAPLAISEFRHAFIRQHTHQTNFVPVLLLLIACSLLINPSRRRNLAHVAVFCAILGAGAGVGLAIPIQRGLLPNRVFLGGPGLPQLCDLATLDQTRNRLDLKSQSNLSPLKLPPGWIQRANEASTGIGTLPWENLYCPANKLSWDPTPTIQLYHSYTARLDSWGASHYSGSRGPKLIINEWVPVGLRLQMVDAPATWRAILLNYSIVDFEIERRIALLERREQPLDQPMVDLGTESFD
ncbi:MAG: hypothetical protein GY906_32900, partial [bacterium]|nr:hypothetical protein [bacterium]